MCPYNIRGNCEFFIYRSLCADRGGFWVFLSHRTAPCFGLFSFYKSPFCCFAAVTVFFKSVAIVIGPTPPGTGVM